MDGVQGCLLEVTVVKCKHLKHTEFGSRQEDPYVCFEYGSSRYHTRSCKDGDQGLVFQDKHTFTLFEGSTEINISVYNNNSLNQDGLIGRGRVHLQRVISQGYDDTTWPIFGESGMTTGEVCLMLCCPNNKILALSAAPYNFLATTHLPNPYHQSNSPIPSYLAPYYQPGPVSNLMNMSRGLKRPLLFEDYGNNEEELGRDLMRRRLTMEAEGDHLQPTEILDIAMDELLDNTSPATLDEDTEMGYASHLPSNPYSTVWDTICF